MSPFAKGMVVKAIRFDAFVFLCYSTIVVIDFSKFDADNYLVVRVTFNYSCKTLAKLAKHWTIKE